MVTAKTQYSLRNAQEYFEEHLAVGDYYDEEQRVSGEWWGTGAERLGLSGKVRANDFLGLCGNQHPATGETLTQRTNEGKQQHLRLVFATHEVSVRGNSLRRVETAMQRMELSLLTPLAGNQRSLVPDGQPVVSEIEVTEAVAKDQPGNAVRS